MRLFFAKKNQKIRKYMKKEYFLKKNDYILFWVVFLTKLKGGKFAGSVAVTF